MRLFTNLLHHLLHRRKKRKRYKIPHKLQHYNNLLSKETLPPASLKCKKRNGKEDSNSIHGNPKLFRN